MTRLVALLLAALLAGCTTDLSAQHAEVFITRDGEIVFETPPRSTGETIFTIENNDDQPHKLVLARLDDRLDADQLPIDASTATVPSGRPSDLRFGGDGYTITNKLDDMRPYYGSGERVALTVHTHLAPGRYVLFDNLPGGYRSGIAATFRIEGPDA